MLKLGPRVFEDGCSFSILAPQATGAEIRLFDDLSATSPSSRAAAVRDPATGIWEAWVPGVGQGCLYAWSIDGPRDLPGADFDPDRLLLDPSGWEIARMPGVPGFPALSRVATLSAGPKPRRPRVLAGERVYYELHAKGFTRLHPEVPRELRGTWAGLAHPSVVSYIKGLGATTVELLPVHAHLDDDFLVRRGLANFWGYSTLSWFAPHPAWASRPGSQADEFRQMVRDFHRAGLEVVLDVVFNHSCEGGPDGPVTGLRGLGSWYRLDPRDPARFEDFTGCGNTLDFRLPHVRAFVLASLRHWVQHMEVDGFRFDLASVCGRMEGAFQPDAPFFQELARDPVLEGVVLVAEPWDATAQGYGVGRFPVPWSEWNDRFRDDMRRFWNGEGDATAFARRLAGSPDLYPFRGEFASVNYAACHDGFTLRDLATYSKKRNEANGEANRDGSDWNHSDNCGTEGETSDSVVVGRRRTRVRNLLASALLARGTPLLLAGDERGRTQGGNNNAYCQDNEVSWVDWSASEGGIEPSWVRQVLDLRADFAEVEEVRHHPTTSSRLAAVEFVAGDRRRILAAHAGSGEADLVLPEGEWVLRLDTFLGATLPPGTRRGTASVTGERLVVWDLVGR